MKTSGKTRRCVHRALCVSPRADFPTREDSRSAEEADARGDSIDDDEEDKDEDEDDRGVKRHF